MGKNTRTFNKDFRDAKASRSLSKPRDIDYTSKMGYQDGSPFSNRPYIDINTPSGYIDMSNTGIPLFANGQLLPPYSGMHFMGTNNVREIPAAMYGGDPSLPNITGHYPFGGQYTKTHTHMKHGGWLDNSDLPKAQGQDPTSIVKGEKIPFIDKKFIFTQDDLVNPAIQERAAECNHGECLEGANIYLNKYVTPRFVEMPNSWKINELYGIQSGNDKLPYGSSADSWDLAGLLQAKGAIQNYAAPLYSKTGERNDEAAAQRAWENMSPEEKKKIYSQMSLGTLVNYGDYGMFPERRSGSNEKAGLYPSRHSARVVGFTEEGLPVVYDMGSIEPLDLSGLGHPITNITTPKEYAKYNFDFVKDWQEKNKEQYYDPNEKLFLTGKNIREDESPVNEEEQEFVKGINRNIKRLMEITGASQQDVINAGKVAFGILQNETRGGRGSTKASVKEILKLFDVFGDETSTGYTRMKKKTLSGDGTNTYTKYLKDLGLDPVRMDLWNPRIAGLATTALVLSRKGNLEGVDKWYLRAQQHNRPAFGDKDIELLKQGDKSYADAVIENASRLYSPSTGQGLPETQKWLSEKKKVIKQKDKEKEKEKLQEIKENPEINPRIYLQDFNKLYSPSESTKFNNIRVDKMNKKKMGGWLDDMPQAQDGRTFRRYPIEPFNKNYWGNFEKDMMRRLNEDTDWSLRNEAMKSGVRTGEHNGPLDAIRHAGTAVGMTNILPKALNKFPLNVIATNVMGLAHELNAPKMNPWKEFASDAYNNLIGSLIGALPISDEMKKLAVVSAGKSGVLSDLGDTHEFVDRGFRPWNTPRPGTTPFNPVQLEEVKITPKTELMLNPRKSKMMYGGLPKAQGTEPTSIVKNKADEALTLPLIEGYQLPETPIVDDRPAWMKEYEKANPQQAYIEKQKADYLGTNPGLNKLFGVSATNFPKEVEQNFADKYLYERNSKRIEDIAKQKGIDPSDRTALLSNLSEGEKLLLANSKYQGLVKPSYISRTLAGLQDFGMRTIPGMSNFRMPVPGMTAKEIMDIKNENILGVPTGPLQSLSFMDIPGTFPANYLKNRGLSTGSDYKQMPGFGQVLPNVDDADVAAMNILNYATAAGDIEGMLSAIRSSPKLARQLATKGKDILKRKPMPQGASGVMDDAARAAFLRTNNIDPQAIYGTQPTANVNPLEQRRMQEILDNLKENDPELYDAYMRGDYTNQPTYEYLDVKPEEQDLEELRQILRTEEDNIRNQQEGNERLLREILATDADDTDDPFGGSGSPVYTWTNADMNDAFEQYRRQRERNAALYNSLGRDPAYQAYERASRQADIDAMSRMPDPSDVTTSNQLPPPPSEITIPSFLTERFTNPQSTSYVRPVGIRDLPGPDQITDIPSRNINAIHDAESFSRVIDNWSADNRLQMDNVDANFLSRFADISGHYNVDYNSPDPFANLTSDEERDFFREMARAIPNRLTADEVNRFRNPAPNPFRNARRTPQPPATNGSSYTKEEAAAKVPESERNKILNMTDEEFKNTAFDVDGKLIEYKSKKNIKTENVSYDEDTGQLVIKNKKPLSKKDYIKKFNDNIDRLNEIIEQKNATESAVGKKYTYKVKKLTDDGQIIFETPAQHDIANPGTSSWRVTVSPGEFFGEVEDIPSVDYYKALPGIEMNVTTSSVFPDYKPRKGTKTYEALNEFLKEMNLGRIKPGFNSQTSTQYDNMGNIIRVGSKDVWKNFVKKGKAFGITGDTMNTIYGIMKRKGGQLKSLPKKGTSKNIKSSLNKIMARNTTLFGESGKKFYDPNVKPYYKSGGWLDDVK